MTDYDTTIYYIVVTWGLTDKVAYRYDKATMTRNRKIYPSKPFSIWIIELKIGQFFIWFGFQDNSSNEQCMLHIISSIIVNWLII